MSTILKLQTDVTSPIYPSFLNFFRVDATDPSIDFFRVDRWQKNSQKISIFMTSYLITIHDASLIFTIMQTTPTHTYS